MAIGRGRPQTEDILAPKVVVGRTLTVQLCCYELVLIKSIDDQGCSIRMGRKLMGAPATAGGVPSVELSGLFRRLEILVYLIYLSYCLRTYFAAALFGVEAIYC